MLLVPMDIIPTLLNFTGTLNDVFTIAHELGHVMHTYYSNKYQPFIDSTIQFLQRK